MALLTAAEIKRIEKKFPDGIKAGSIVEIFKDKGARFSEATLRKYVQLELLPKSKRVGTRGRYKGSAGLYPVEIVRLINEIKRALDEGATLEEIRVGRVGLSGELQTLRRASDQVLARFAEAADKVPDKKAKTTLKRLVDARKKQIDKEVRELEKLATKIGRSGPSVL